jgi:isopentenyldiphosphate isomerase
MELLEYFDENNEKSIAIEEREYIHKNNLWHREVAVWVMNEKNELLLQRRSSKKKQGANKFSITAGHVEVNEQEILAAIREAKEEIGLDFSQNELKLIDIYRNERENNMCFSYTYFVKTNKKIEDMTMQEDEVSELKFISIEDLEDKIRNQDEEIPFVKKPYIKLIIEWIKVQI